MRTTRRSLLTMMGASAFAGSALANPAGPAPGGADRGGGTFDSENSLDRIPLILADGYRFTVLYLMLATATQLFVFTTLNAVVQRNENRLPVARLPFLNQIIRADYRRDDFELARKVAMYYLLGSTLFIDLRLRSMMEPVANLSTDWDQLERKLAADAQRPVNGEIMVESENAGLAAPVSTVTVFNRDSSYSMLLGGRAISEEGRAAALPFLSNLPLTGNLFRSGNATRKERELLVMVQPSIVERSWD